MRGALTWALERGEPELGLSIVASLARFWWARAPAEGLVWAERALRETHGSGPDRVAALDAAGGSAWFLGDHELALLRFEEALATSRLRGDRAGVASMLNRIAPPLVAAGRVGEARAAAEESLAINRELDARWEVGLSLSILGGLAREDRDWSRAKPLFEEAVEVARRAGDVWSTIPELVNLAEIAVREGELDRAVRLGREALLSARELGDRLWVTYALGVLATAVAAAGAARTAGALWGAAERLDVELGETMWRRERGVYLELLGPTGHGFEEGVESVRSLPAEEALEVALAAVD